MSEDSTETGIAGNSIAELTARCEQLEREIVLVKDRAASSMVKVHLHAEAARAGMVDLDGLKMLDLSQVTVTESGDVQGAAALMDKVRKDKPWLFGKPSTSNPGGAPPSQSPRQKLATEMTDAEYQTAREAIVRYRP